MNTYFTNTWNVIGVFILGGKQKFAWFRKNIRVFQKKGQRRNNSLSILNASKILNIEEKTVHRSDAYCRVCIKYAILCRYILAYILNFYRTPKLERDERYSLVSYPNLNFHILTCVLDSLITITIRKKFIPSSRKYYNAIILCKIMQFFHEQFSMGIDGY